ncbi:MAG: YbeD family protein [Gammaproteobacteria bacterium]
MTDSLLEFPCSFPIKAVGKDENDFQSRIIALVATQASFDPQQDVRSQPSRNGRFISVTVTIEAQSQQQIDDIYRALHAADIVLMAL